MTFPDKVNQAVAVQVRQALQEIGEFTAAGSVVTRTGPTTATVTFDGSQVATPVKVFGDVNVNQGDRVGLVKLGVDWTIVGTFSRRRSITMPDVTDDGLSIVDDKSTGQIRMVWGGDTPPELQSYGLEVAMRAYVTDVGTGIEVGYFFIGVSNRMDAGAVYRAMVFGNVTYPTAGRPDTATSANVKTNFQQDMFTQAAFTIFKDHHVQLNPDVNLLVSDTGRIIMFGGSTTKDLTGSVANLNTATGSGSTTSGSYANLPATSSFTFVKQKAATQVRIDLHCTAYSSATATQVELAVLINGTDYTVTSVYFNTANEHDQISGTALVASGLAAGSYTVQVRWRRSQGSGTVQVDANDRLSVTAAEVSV